MNESDALDLIEKTVWTIVLGAGPAVTAAMTVGLIIALFQALTQIQEMTLTFVPKILIVFLTLGLSASFVGERIATFTAYVYGRIEKGF
jgi:flagellar biosynthesis protein FliQ